MTPEIKAFKFPTWEEIVEGNKPFLEAQEYKGLHIQVQVEDNLYLLIDCQNNSCVFPTSKDVIRFAWATKNEFAITSVVYENCEPGYIMGCTHLINMADRFKKCFEEFTGAHVFNMRRRIAAYNEAHPEPEETPTQETEGQEEPDEGGR